MSWTTPAEQSIRAEWDDRKSIPQLISCEQHSNAQNKTEEWRVCCPCFLSFELSSAAFVIQKNSSSQLAHIAQDCCGRTLDSGSSFLTVTNSKVWNGMHLTKDCNKIWTSLSQTSVSITDLSSCYKTNGRKFYYFKSWRYTQYWIKFHHTLNDSVQCCCFTPLKRYLKLNKTFSKGIFTVTVL